MRRLLVIACLLIVAPISGRTTALDLSAFPRLPHAVRDACWIENTLYFVTEAGVFQAVQNGAAWDSREIIKTGPASIPWSIGCDDLLPAPGEELVVSRVRNGVWRSMVLVSGDTGWQIALDDLPFALRHTRWQGAPAWVGDARFPQATGRGEFFLLNDGAGKLKLGKKIRLPRGSVLDNWVELPNGDIAVLRGRRMEIFTNGPRWKMKQHVPAGGMTTLCAESQPWVMSSVGVMFCRQLAPSVWNTMLLAPRNLLVAEQVVGHVPMIDHGEMFVYSRDSNLDVYQMSGMQGPLAGELAAYFIDKNPVDKQETLFLVVQMRTAAEAVGGLTKYSVLIPVALESLQSGK